MSEFDFGPELEIEAPLGLDELLKRAEDELEQEMNQQEEMEMDMDMEKDVDLGIEGNVEKTDLQAVEDLLGGDSANLKDQPKEKKKREVAKLTEEMMMGPRGLTNLIQRAKRFKKRSSQDKTLDAFMEMMHLWGHDVFPKEKFKDFIGTSQKLCTKRGMREFREREIREARRHKNGYYDNIITKSIAKPRKDPIDVDPSTVPITHSTDSFAGIDSDLAVSVQATPAVSTPVGGLVGAAVTATEPTSTQSEVNLTSNVSVLSNDKLAIIELNRQKAMAKLAERQRLREEERNAKEREEEVAKLLGENRHLFSL